MMKLAPVPGFRRAEDPAHAAGRADLLRVRAFLQKNELAVTLRALEKRRPWACAYHVIMSWTVVAIAVALVLRSVWLMPIALLAIASRQRAFGNVLHDFVHGNVVRAPKGWLKWIIAAPAFEDFDRYRRLHFLHHAHLGHPKLDPDYVTVPTSKHWMGVCVEFMARPRLWIASVLGDLPQLRWREAAKVGAFWLLAVATVALAASPRAALEFFGLWMLSRATTYHLLKAFVELGDHNAGLKPGSIFGYTRTYPENALTFLIHPYNDRFHLTHHLAPRVPMVTLAAAHAALAGMPEYRDAHHCDGYFFGTYSVVRSFIDAKELAWQKVTPPPPPSDPDSAGGPNAPTADADAPSSVTQDQERAALDYVRGIS